MKIRNLGVLLVCATALSACYSSGPRPLPPVRQAPTVEGTWVDANGLLSTFSNGRFETRTADGTNTLMASGTYVAQSDGIYQLNMFSNYSKTSSLVNCSVGVGSQLNCTTQEGKQFSLARRS
nr:hypothetical protein [Ciceribacter thiooxidans]